jgi:hypothetical protein
MHHGDSDRELSQDLNNPDHAANHAGDQTEVFSRREERQLLSQKLSEGECMMVYASTTSIKLLPVSTYPPVQSMFRVDVRHV